MAQRVVVPVVVLMAVVVFAKTTWATNGYDIFVTIEGIEGAGPHDKIEALGLGEGVTNVVGTTSSGGGASGQGAEFTDVSIIKRIDQASPKLFVECAAGTRFPQVSIEFVRDGAVFYQIKLSDVILSGVRLNAGGDGVTEFVTFAFVKIEWTYTVFDANGKPIRHVSGGWDRVANRKL